MCGVRPRFSWITSTAPLGSSAAANAPISSPFGPAKRISSAATVLGATPLRPDADGVDDGAAAVVDAAAVDGAAVVVVAAAVDDAAVEPVVVADALSPSSLEQAASKATAAVLLNPSSPSRRNASRRVRWPSAQSRAT